MNDTANKAFRELAAASKATVIEELYLSFMDDGAATLLEASDSGEYARMALPTSQVPQLAATLLRHWQQSDQTTARQGQVPSVTSLSQEMESFGLEVSGIKAHALSGDRVRLGFIINGATLYLDLPARLAVALTCNILASLECDPPASSPRQ
ncbi:hypothetical protein [Nitratidesulfovibrio termitidis]|uniref:hypothetical protein n=1 Tax=Nitratidesulfovibrio termitidis TaxID=42252 RepID=UPI0003FFD7B5|nr:hypothetical protein [Nitratidesulfovibrio termitidis]